MIRLIGHIDFSSPDCEIPWIVELPVSGSISAPTIYEVPITAPSGNPVISMVHHIQITIFGEINAMWTV
jgi:hypothetical protein